MRLGRVFALATLLAACASAGGVDGPVLTSPRAWPWGDAGGMAAEVKGTVVYDSESECLRLELEGVQYPVVWPDGTRWQETPPSVVLRGGARAEPGSSVYGGGGYLGPAHVRDVAGDQVAAEATRCIGPTAEVAFFNVGSEVDLVSD
jgi:hypothetical protein